MEIIGKISVKTVIGNKKIINDAISTYRGASVPIMRVVGRVTGIERGSSTYGEWLALKGNFQATNILNGEIFMSGTAFLDTTYCETIEEELLKDEVSVVEIAVDVNAASSETSQSGYIYSLRPLLNNTFNPFEKLISGLPPVKDVVPLLEDAADDQEDGGDDSEENVSAKKR